MLASVVFGAWFLLFLVSKPVEALLRVPLREFLGPGGPTIPSPTRTTKLGCNYGTVVSACRATSRRRHSTAREDSRFVEDQMRFIDTIDTIVLGRATYEMFAGDWPTATGDDKLFAVSAAEGRSAVRASGRWR